MRLSQFPLRLSLNKTTKSASLQKLRVAVITMPSDDTFLQQAEEFKTKGNDSFGKGSYDEAISSYSSGIVACDRMAESPSVKATLLSNRAACYLKLSKHELCKNDCTVALKSSSIDEKLRSKLLYRRAKALAALQDIQEAAKDCMAVLQMDPSNKEIQQLLTILRAQHKTASTPVAKTLQSLHDSNDNTEHQLRILLGLVDQDLSNAAQELARLGGLDKLMEVAASSSSAKASSLALQVVRSIAGNPSTLRSHVLAYQSKLKEILQAATEENIIIGCLAIWVRIILHADRDDPDAEIAGTTAIDYTCLLDTIRAALRSSNHQFPSVLRAVLDVMSTWMAGADRDSAIRSALDADNAKDPRVPIPKSQAEIRCFSPQELAAYKKRQHEQKNRDQAWAYERARLFSQTNLRSLLATACSATDATIRRECTVAVSRIMSCIILEDDVEFKPLKEVISPFLQSEQQEGPIIEEVYDEDEKEELSVTSLETKMERALIASALLLSNKEAGMWAMNHGWTDSGSDIPDLIASGDLRAMGMASELLSAAATVEGVRGHVSDLDLTALLRSGDSDIRSGAAAAVAKLGLSDKAAKDEGEMMGLLQAACELLGEQDSSATEAKDSKLVKKTGSLSTFGTSSLERAIEMISYLATHTTIKEELAAGFSSPNGPESALEYLVQTADKPSAGESLSGYALASIFQNLSVTNEQLRREAFEGKEVTMEQYDEMQRMGKTEEEKEVMDQEKDPDTSELCFERIRQMAKAGVPRALVALSDGASEQTLGQVVLTMTRMANEKSVRGVMIQQGVLSACIKIEKKEGPTDTDAMKKLVRFARHTIAKLLVTTNPSLLTSAQRLGSIKPLLLLLRDIKSSDLQRFESLLSLTNVASSGEDAKNRIVTEKGIPALHYAMFSDHEKVRQASTEAMCNLVGHKAMTDHLSKEENLRLWLAFAVDYEENYECARAAAGCLAMATQDEIVALELSKLEKFRAHFTSLLESGRLEIMQRILVAVLNLVLHGSETREKAISEGLVAFCQAYIELQNHSNEELEFSAEEKKLLPMTVDIAKEVVKNSET